MSLQLRLSFHAMFFSPAHSLPSTQVGSGFDVCSACYGSCRFSRIPAHELSAAMAVAESALNGKSRHSSSSGIDDGGDATYSAWGESLLSLAGLRRREGDTAAPPATGGGGGGGAGAGAGGGGAGGGGGGAGGGGGDGGAGVWRFTAEPFVLPRGITLMLADVAGGSETPGMVKRVLEWVQRQPRAEEEEEEVERLGDGAGMIEEVEEGEGAVLGEAEEGEVEERAAASAAASTASSTVSGPRLWHALARANARVDSTLAALAALVHLTPPHVYAATITLAASLPCGEWGTLLVHNKPLSTHFHSAGSPSETRPSRRVLRKLMSLSHAFACARRLIAAVGTASGVPIEPPCQTSLADTTLSLNGVIAAGVPGAGGFDALFAVVLDPEAVASNSDTGVAGDGGGGGSSNRTVRQCVEAAWAAWPGGGLTPLLLRAGGARGQQDAGVLCEW